MEKHTTSRVDTDFPLVPYYTTAGKILLHALLLRLTSPNRRKHRPHSSAYNTLYVLRLRKLNGEPNR